MLLQLSTFGQDTYGIFGNILEDVEKDGGNIDPSDFSKILINVVDSDFIYMWNWRKLVNENNLTVYGARDVTAPLASLVEDKGDLLQLLTLL